MALPDLLFPISLPNFRADSHRLTPEAMYGQVERQGGFSRRRRLFTSVPRILEAELDVTQAALEDFYAWHEGPLLAGERPFAALVAKVGSGLEYWTAHCLSFTVEHLEGSHHKLSLRIRLSGTPQDTAPVLSSLAAEISVALLFNFPGLDSLGSEASAALEFFGSAGDALAAEAIAQLLTEFDGPAYSGLLTSEVYVNLECYAIAEASSALVAEASALLNFWEQEASSALSAEVSAAVFLTNGTSGPVASPASFSSAAYRGYYTNGYATATVQVRNDGGVYERMNDDGYVLNDNWYSPATPGIGTGYWVKYTVLTGSAPTVAVSASVGVVLQLNISRTWVLKRSAVGVSSGTGRIDISTDPDGYSIVSSFTGTLEAEYAT